MDTRTAFPTLSLNSYFFLVLLLSFLFPTWAQANPRISFSSEWRNRYIGVVGVPVYEKPVFTSTLFIGFDAGYYGGVFYATDVADIGQGGFSTTWGDELDWFIGWQGNIFGDFQLKTQVVYLDLFKVIEDQDNDVFRFIIEVNNVFTLDQHTLIPFAAIWTNQPVHGDTPERGTDTIIGVRHKYNYSDLLSLFQEVEIRKDGGFAGREPTTLLRYQVKPSWKISKKFALHPLIFRFSGPLTSTHERDSEWVWGTGLTIQF